MDDLTLNSLANAYAAAPSEELAKILVLAYIDRKDTTSALAFIPGLSPNLDFVDFCRVSGALTELEDTVVLTDLLTKVNAIEPQTVILQLLSEEKVAYARILYDVWQSIDSKVHSPSLDSKFGIGKEAKTEKVKLRVVEKTDVVADLTRYREASTNFSDVVGLENIKKQIHKKIILPFQKPSLFQKFKKKIGGGVLLYGPPGCGKTLLARATAGECNASFFNIEIADVLDMYIGESEQKLRSIFEKARGEAPSVMFFDELEALAGKREQRTNGSLSNTISQFLTELDGFTQNNEGVLVLASTNVPWSIDPAFLRPGRFDRMFFVPPPDKSARASILQHHMKERPTADGIDYSLLAAKTGGYSGADLTNLVEMAADEAIDASIEKEKEIGISFEHFKTALTESRSTAVEWLTTARNYARYSNDSGRYNDVLEFLKKHGK